MSMKRTPCPPSPTHWILAAALLIFAPFAPADDFAGALARAYGSNPDLAIARSQLSATDQGVALAQAARRPAISAFAFRGRAVFNQWPYSQIAKPSALREFHYKQSNLGINITQPVYSGGALDAQRAGAEAQVLATRAALQQTEQQVLLAAASAYLDLWLAERKLAILQQNEKDLNRQLQASRRQFERKDITVTDLGQTETRLAQAVSERLQGENTVADARMTYRVVIGVEPGPLAGLPALNLTPPNLDEALARAGNANPSIHSAVQSKNAALEGIEIQKAGWKPTVSLDFLRLSSRGAAAGTPRLDQQSLLLNLGVPIYQGGAVGAKIRTAREQAGKAETAVEESRRSIVQATGNAWYQLQAATEAVDSYRVQVASAELALKGVDLAAAHGTRTVLDTLNARMELENARLSLEQAEHDRILAYLQLLAAMGELNARTLGLAVEYHDPQPHYEQTKARWSDWDWGR